MSERRPFGSDKSWMGEPARALRTAQTLRGIALQDREVAPPQFEVDISSTASQAEPTSHTPERRPLPASVESQLELAESLGVRVFGLSGNELAFGDTLDLSSVPELPSREVLERMAEAGEKLILVKARTVEEMQTGAEKNGKGAIRANYLGGGDRDASLHAPSSLSQSYEWHAASGGPVEATNAKGERETTLGRDMVGQIHLLIGELKTAFGDNAPEEFVHAVKEFSSQAKALAKRAEQVRQGKKSWQQLNRDILNLEIVKRYVPNLVDLLNIAMVMKAEGDTSLDNIVLRSSGLTDGGSVAYAGHGRPAGFIVYGDDAYDRYGLGLASLRPLES